MQFYDFQCHENVYNVMHLVIVNVMYKYTGLVLLLVPLTYMYVRTYMVLDNREV